LAIRGGISHLISSLRRKVRYEPSKTNKIPCSYFDKKAPSLESEQYCPRIEADLGRVFANSVVKDPLATSIGMVLLCVDVVH